MFGKLLMKISEKMEKWIQKKPEEKVPVDIEKKDLKNQEDLSATESLGLSGPPCWEWMLILDSGEFYFPEDNLNKYSIIKYDKLGKPRLIFGREYQIEKYSEEAREELYSKHKKSIDMGKTKFPPAPPVIRTMFQDSRENIWVISGETYEDNMNPNYENSVDIFNKEGKWLYFFKSKNISKNCFYNDGKIYKVLPLDPEIYAQFIEVYEIKYLAYQ